MGKSSLLALLLAVLLVMPICLADDRVFLLSLRYDSEQKNLSFESLSVTYGAPYLPQTEGGENYTVKLTKGTEVIFSDYFTTFFVCLGCENSTSHGITLYLPYNSSAEKAEIWNGNSIALIVDLTGVCNQNSLCEKDLGENYFSCPSDCPTGAADGICDLIKDGRCDPDCNPGIDFDCVTTPENNPVSPPENNSVSPPENDSPSDNTTAENPPAEPFWQTYWWLMLLAGVLAVLVIAYIYVKKKSKKSQPEQPTYPSGRDQPEQNPPGGQDPSRGQDNPPEQYPPQQEPYYGNPPQ